MSLVLSLKYRLASLGSFFGCGWSFPPAPLLEGIPDAEKNNLNPWALIPYRPQKARVLIMGTPKMVPPILGNSNMLARELQAAQRMLTRSEQEVRKPKRAGISWLSHVEGCVNCGFVWVL